MSLLEAIGTLYGVQRTGAIQIAEVLAQVAAALS